MLTGLLWHVPSEFRSCSGGRCHFLMEARVPLPARLMVPTFHRPYAPPASPFFLQTLGWCLLSVLLHSEPFPNSLFHLGPCSARNYCPELQLSSALPRHRGLLMLFHQLHTSGKDLSHRRLPSFQFPLCSHIPVVATAAKYLTTAGTWYQPRPVILFSHIPELCPVFPDPMEVRELPAPAELRTGSGLPEPLAIFEGLSPLHQTCGSLPS